VAHADGLTTSQDVTASAATSFTGDDLINCFFDLKEAYQRNASWLVSRTFVKNARKLKDGNAQYLWQPGLGGAPGTLLDRPVRIDENVPATYTTGLYVAAVGDFKQGYYIQDGLGLEIQRLDELLALTNQVGFLARKETDGMVVLPEALRRLKLA
jgi:HK97 family phage major capsid protein